VVSRYSDCSIGTVKSHVSRGLAKLREHHLVTAVAAPAQKEG